MKWILIGLAVVVGVVAIAAIVGSMLPRAHVASRTLRVHRTPDEVWAAITELTAASSVPADVLERDPPRRLVSRVKETEKNFGGTWTIVIAPVSDPSTLREPQGRPEQGRGATGSGQVACTLTITEDGWVANPIFRFMSRVVIGHHATMDGILKQVAKRFNEEPAISGE